MSYDALLVIAVLMVAAAAVVIPFGSEIGPGTAWFQIYLLAAWWAYFAICWRVGGQTLGMRAWRVKLVRDDHRRIGWLATAARFALAFVSAAPAGLGYLWCLFDPSRRAWHDLATSTRLVVLPKTTKAD